MFKPNEFNAFLLPEVSLAAVDCILALKHFIRLKLIEYRLILRNFELQECRMNHCLPECDQYIRDKIIFKISNEAVQIVNYVLHISEKIEQQLFIQFLAKKKILKSISLIMC